MRDQATELGVERPALSDHPVAHAQLDEVVRLARDVLGSDAIGAYLFGSAVVGGLKPHSDLDVLVVSRRPTTTTERHVLLDRLLTISGPGHPLPQARSVDVAVIVEADVRPWRYPPPMDFQYGDWLRSEFEGGNLTPWRTPNPDLTTLLAMALRCSEPLFGPRLADVLDSIPPRDIVRGTLDAVDSMVDDIESDTRNVILTLARVWVTVATGDHRSKDEAADWALERLPAEHREVLARARAIYLGHQDERWDDLREGVRPHAEYVAREIERLVGTSTEES